MQRIRQIHLWLGVLFSPLILFFACTGLLQTFGWHQSLKSGYTAPAWLAKLAAIHTHQRLTRGGPGGPSALPLKWFVACMAVGLVVTSVLGIYLAFKYQRDRRVVWAMIVAGVLLPVGLLFL